MPASAPAGPRSAPLAGRLARAAALVAVYALATTVGPTSDTAINDLYVYSVYQDLLQQGYAAYSGFGFEYPPLALYPIAIFGGSAWQLGIAMLVCLLATQWCCDELCGPLAGWLMALTPLLLGAMVRTHFDALPALLAMAAMLCFAREHPRWGFVLLAVGGMVKLWPLVLVPVAIVWLVARGQRRAALEGTAIALAICVVVLAPYPWHGLRDAVRFHQERPVQIESTPATVLWLAGDSFITGDPVRPDRFKSNGLDGGPAHTVSVLATILEVLAILGAAALAARRRDARHLVLCCFLAAIAFVALGKVLSPQYLVWLTPFAAVAFAWGARVPAALIALACVLTQIEFPRRYFDLVADDDTTFAIVGVRNVALIVAGLSLAAALARSPSPVRPRAPSPARP
jgi:uncharacterized membrane protein